MAGDMETDVSWYYSLAEGQGGGEGGRGEAEREGGEGGDKTGEDERKDTVTERGVEAAKGWSVGGG